MNTNFLSELISRIAKANPRFFKIIQVIAIGVAGASVAMKYVADHLPWYLSWLQSDSALISSIVATIMAQLPNKNPNAGK